MGVRWPLGRGPALVGPMQATTGGIASMPNRDRKPVTVDDDVKATASAWATLAPKSGSGGGVTVR